MIKFIWIFLLLSIFLSGCKQQQDQSINNPDVSDYTVSGIVSEEGGGIISGAEVRIGDIVDHTDASGRYSLIGVQSGIDTIMCTSTKDSYESFSEIVSIGKANKIFDITLIPRKYIKFSELFKPYSSTFWYMVLIDKDTTLAKKHSPYIVDEFTHISKTLTLEPGVTLIFQYTPGYPTGIVMNEPQGGKIVAIGNVSDKISFISSTDSTWYMITSSSVKSEFAYCNFSTYSSLSLHNSSIQFSKFDGGSIASYDSTNVFDHNTILSGRTMNSFEYFNISYAQIESPNYDTYINTGGYHFSNSNIMSGKISVHYGDVITFNHCYISPSVQISDSSLVTFESPSMTPISGAGCGW